MTYADYITNATPEERAELRKKIENIIGRKEDCVNDNMDRSDRITARTNYDKLYEKLTKIWLEHGDRALAMNYTNKGTWVEGTTPDGKKWVFSLNSFGWTQRCHHCGSLYIEGQGTIFTSGTLARAFERILEN